MTRAILLFLTIVVALPLVSCHGTAEQAQQDSGDTPSGDSVVKYNQEMVRAESQEIEDFIARYRWDMKTTATGLRYMIYRHGKGRTAGPADSVQVVFRVSLLTGEQVFATDPSKPAGIILGKRDVVSGLEEGIMLMQAGDRARLIVPSHLAYGLLGDLEKIPARAALVYDVELVAVHPRKK